MVSGSSRGKELDPATTSLLPVTDANDACLWVADHVCNTPRSCYDCLNTAPAKGQCVVDPMGRCVRLDSTATSGRLPFLPSTVTRYCDASDATCAACRKRTDATGGYYVANGTSTLKPFCVGASGCVCVAACEAPTWSVNVLAVCPPSLEAARAQQSTLYAVFLVFSCVLGTFVYFFSVGWRKPHSPSDLSEGDAPSWPRRRPKGRRLALTGWLSMRQKLIDEEAGQPTTTAIIIHKPIGYREQDDSSPAADAA